MYHGDRIPGFPKHPHRGFETLTCTMDGLIDHADSMGNAARYGQGDLQWLTAAGGIMHSEMFPLVHEDKHNPTRFFQIWQVDLSGHRVSMCELVCRNVPGWPCVFSMQWRSRSSFGLFLSHSLCSFVLLTSYPGDVFATCRLNLPAKSKMVTPSFTMHWGQDIPQFSTPDGMGGTVTLWAGEVTEPKPMKVRSRCLILFDLPYMVRPNPTISRSN